MTDSATREIHRKALRRRQRNKKAIYLQASTMVEVKVQGDMTFESAEVGVKGTGSAVIGGGHFSTKGIGTVTPKRRAPGSWMLAFARFFCTKKDYEHIIGQMIADMRQEHAEALGEGRRLRAAWLRVLYVWRFLNGVGLVKVFALVKALLSFLFPWL